MSGESKPSYPPGATRTVSVKATPEQKSTWEAVGHNHGLSAGGFLAFTADLYLAMYRAYLEANDAHYDALHPASNSSAAEVRAAYSRYFPGMPVVLCAQDSSGVPTYWGRPDIAKFLASISMDRIPWKTYTVN